MCIRDSGWDLDDQVVHGISTSVGEWRADQFCLAAGVWTPRLGLELGLNMDIDPWRGQMVLYRLDEPLLRTVVNQGPQYLVPRRDHRILVGSTMEEVGFEAEPTEEGVRRLVEFATGILPSLRAAVVEKSWAGLRPASGDGRPLIGRAPAFENLYVATGHFRNGIFLAPGTARLLAQEMMAEPPELSLSSFAVGRN